MSSEWPQVSLREFADLLAGFAFKSSGYTEDSADVRLLRGDNIAPGKVRWDGVKRWPSDKVVELSRYALEPGDVVLAMDRPWIPAGLKVAQVNETDTPSYLVQRVARLRTISLGDRSFLFALLSTPDFESYIRNATTGTAVPHISAKQILDYAFKLPPVHVRAEVGALAAALDDRIALLRETNATLEAIAQALFKSWFVDFDPVRAKQQGLAPEGMDEATAALFPDGFEESELGLVPKGWQSTTLAEVGFRHGGTIQTGPFGSQLHASDYVDSGIPVVMPKDIQHRRVMTDSIARVSSNDADRLGRHKLQRGDIVFSRRGDVERHALIGERETGWLCGTGCLLVRPGSRWLSPTFLSLTLDAPRARGWLVQQAVGATMPNLNTGILGSVPVLLPTVDVLRLFEEIISVTEAQRNHNASTMETLAALRDTLLPRLISGQLRLPEAQAELEGARP